MRHPGTLGTLDRAIVEALLLSGGAGYPLLGGPRRSILIDVMRPFG
jgi:hypothetical protein